MNNLRPSKDKLLWVSDHVDSTSVIDTLLHAGYEIIKSDINTCIETARLNLPAAIIINVTAIEGSVIEVCRILRLHRRFNKTAIMFLASSAEEETTARSHEAGADFLFTKPISSTLMVSRIRAFHRRFQTKIENISEVGDIVIDRETYMVMQNKIPVKLSPKEFELLSLLISRKGKVFYGKDILNTVWDSAADIRIVDVHICKLRQKLIRGSIQTIKGVGYKMAVEVVPEKLHRALFNDGYT